MSPKGYARRQRHALIHKKEQNFFFEKKKQKTFVC